MQVDKTTLTDLSIFHAEEELSVFHHLNFTHTNGGRAYLRLILNEPLPSLPAIEDTQKTICQFIGIAGQWPVSITNGTIMVLEKYYDTPVDSHASHPSAISAFLYKVFKKPDYSFINYSVEHFISFIKGLQQIILLLEHPESKQVHKWKERVEMLLSKPNIREMLQHKKNKRLSPVETLSFGYFIRNHFKQHVFELIDIYNRMDAYLGLAIACKKYQFTFPVFKESGPPFIKTDDLFHLQLTDPVSYNVHLNNESNFLFLTGANMGGKSTFIKAMGISVYLAHLGMGVPAKKMELSLFDGVLSNIQVADNIVKGESFFFNEVQRIKSTIEKISDGKKWMILIDELFKGTNQQDAVKCSITVIEGLRKMQNALFILSTHLYEIGESLQQYNNIQFRYFETTVADDQLIFSYQLKEGISNDRLGYLILRKEGVVDMLEKL